MGFNINENMPGQNLELELQKNFAIKLLKMEPGIPQNRSDQHLVSDSDDTTIQNDNRYRSIGNVTMTEWFTISILCFINLINYMDRFTVAGILPDIQKTYDIGNAEGGLLQTVFILSYMIFAPIFGYLGDRYSRKLIMAFGVFLWSLTTLLGSFMNNFWLFLIFRGLVGIGEASYSTIAPTIISDLFVKDVRSKMLAFFYFAIPVGSGLGYIIGSVTANAAGSWQWGLRVTPFLGAIAVFLILVVLDEPERGQSEGGEHLRTTSLREDMKDIIKNPSFMLSSAGFTCVAFVAGALSWWGPTLMYLGIRLQPESQNVTLNDVSYVFGILAMISGLLGVPTGSFLAQKLRDKHPNIDPIICAFALIISSPLIYLACILPSSNTVACYFFVFSGEFFLNLTWSLVADILLYVVIPTRRSSAEGFQLLFSHALGDAGSPYLVGIVSDTLNRILRTTPDTSDPIVEFKSLQYAVFITSFVEVLGGVLFLIAALYVVKDREKVEKAVRGSSDFDQSTITTSDGERTSLMT